MIYKVIDKITGEEQCLKAMTIAEAYEEVVEHFGYAVEVNEAIMDEVDIAPLATIQDALDYSYDKGYDSAVKDMGR